MSSPPKKEDLAGHAPAVKVGGMRVTQSKTAHPSKPSAEQIAAEKEEYGDGDTSVNPHTAKTVVSGAVVKGDAEFTASALKQFHEKPLPTKESSHKPKPHNINQPR